MKIRLTRKTNQLASSLLTALVICSILSLFVMYYLSLIEQQSLLSARSQTWNMAIAVSEAGIEDGLQQVNTAWPDMNTDGWTYNGSTCYTKSNYLADGNSYMAYIYITNGMNPTVVSQAYVTPPSFFPLTGTLLLAAGGGGSVSAPATCSRSVEVNCLKKTPWTAAMIAKRTIDLHGNNINTDSFDSANPAESVGGQYTPGYYRGSKGDIASNLGLVNSISGGNANIYGHAHTGPGSASTALQVGASGYVGCYPQSGSGCQSGWWLPDANFTFPNTSYPSTAGYFTPTNGTVVLPAQLTNTVTVDLGLSYPSPAPAGLTTNSTLILAATTDPSLIPGLVYYGASTYKFKGNWVWQYYQVTSYTYPSNYTTTYYTTNSYDHILYGAADLSHTNYYVYDGSLGKAIVTGPNVVLAVPNGLNMSSSDTITFATGANLIIDSGGTSCTVNTQVAFNYPGYAANCLLYCAPTVTSFTMNGNATFCGVVVAPNADVQLNGSGNPATPSDFIGCMMANSVTMNGHFNFHYDEALGGNPAFGRFLITSWNEIKQ
jgi:hypothetical protein